jgi:hypothetical protein
VFDNFTDKLAKPDRVEKGDPGIIQMREAIQKVRVSTHGPAVATAAGAATLKSSPEAAA